MSFIIKAGNVTILHSGSVILYNNLPIDFTIGTLLFRFSFLSDNSKKPSLLAEQIDNDPLKILIKFVNYDSPIGIGNPKPVQVGTIENHTLYLSYRIYSLNDSADKLFHYTFYLEN